MICGNATTVRGFDTTARRRGRMIGLALGAIVQNPETGDWYDDTTGLAVAAPDGSSGLVSTPPGTTDVNIPAAATQPSDWLSSLVKALPGVSAFATAEQLAQVNVQRAKAGQPPLQTSQYAPQVGVGLDAQTKTFITYGGIGLAAVILFSKLRGRRR